jgi:hypothetical protein
MSPERFQPEKPLLPVTTKALTGAFPRRTSIETIRGALLVEAMDMHQNNPHLLPITRSEEHTQGFSDGIRFMYRILRQNRTLPLIDENVLFVSDMEHNRAIANRGKGAKEYFLNKWMAEIQQEPENGPLVDTITRVAEIWTAHRTIATIDDIWGGAYYVTNVFERQNKVDSLKGQFPELFTE